MEGDIVKQNMKDGFSLVELMIALAISSIVLVGVISIIAYGTNNMNLTKARVALQDQAKDAMNHISAYTMEASKVDWYDSKNVLLVTKDVVQNVGTDETITTTDPNNQYVYWIADNKLFFACVTDPGIDVNNLQADQKHLLATDVATFVCKEEKSVSKAEKYLHVQLRLRDEKSEFNCEKDISLRNR